MSSNREKIPRRQFLRATAAASAVAVGGVLPSRGHADGPVASRIVCDVLVYGATPGGIAAAVAAARHGHKVILAEYEDHVGGIVTNGLTNTDLSDKYYGDAEGKRAAVGGFFNEFSGRVLAHYREVDSGVPDRPNVRLCRAGLAYEPWVAEAIFNGFLKEHDVRLLLRHDLKQAIRNGNRVTGAVFEPPDAPGRRVRVDATVLIDATYEGDLIAESKAEFRLGRESREEFQEPHAGMIYMRSPNPDPLPGSTGAGDKLIQAFCFRFTMTADPANRVPIEKPAKYNRDDYRYLLDDFGSGKLTKLNKLFGIFDLPKGKVEFNSRSAAGDTGVPSQSLDLAEENWDWPNATRARRKEIFDRYLTHNVGMLWLVQNDPEVPSEMQREMRQYGFCKDEYAGNHHLPRQVYVREVRRLVGEYLLTEHDGILAEGWKRTRVQPTSIGLVEWRYDSHCVHNYNPAHPGLREGYTFVRHETFQVPYGVLVPKVVDGLLVPLCYSATHIAYSGLRNEPIYFALGEACGQAAHLAIKNRLAPRAISVERLQQALVSNGGAITYFDDLPVTDTAYAPCQWLGARGLNQCYRAELQESLTVGAGAERLRRILENMGHPRPASPADDISRPLQADDVIRWLRAAGFQTPKAGGAAPSPGGLNVGQFATLVYGVVARGNS